MNLSPEEYDQMTKKASPNSKSYKTLPSAFFVGGIICTIGQLLLELYQKMGADSVTASAWVSVSLVFLSALLTWIGVYDNIAKFGGAGSLVPITGFANAVVSPALEFKAEGMIPGLGAKMFVIAGPVIVYGTLASVIYGIILQLIRLFS